MRSSASPTCCCGCGTTSGRERCSLAWDTLDVPTYRHEALEAYSEWAGLRRRAARSSSISLPALVASRRGSRPPRPRATRRTTSSPPRPRGRRRPAARRSSRRRIATRSSSSTNARDRCSSRPEAAPARIGPSRGARALRRRSGAGAGLHRAPRRSVGQDPRRARDRREARGGRSCSSTARSRPMLGAGRFATEAEALRSLPPHRDHGSRRAPARVARRRPGLGEAAAAHATALGLPQVSRAASRRRSRGRDQPSELRHLARACDPSGNPEHPGRLQSLPRAVPDYAVGEPAATDELELVHSQSDTSTRSRRSRARSGSIRTRTRTATTWEAAMPRGRVRDQPRSLAAASRWCGHLATMRSSPAAMGFCIFANVADRGAAMRSASSESTGVAVVDFDVHHGNGTEALFRDDPTRAHGLAPPVAVLAGHGRAGRELRWASSTSRSPRARATTNTERLRRGGRAGCSSLRARSSSSSRPASTRIGTTRSPRWTLTRRRLPRAGAALRRPRATCRRGARRRLQPRDAAGSASPRRSRDSRAVAQAARADSSRSSASRRDETPSFLQEALHVRAHGVLGDEQALRDLVGAEVLVEEQQHLDLAGREHDA